MRYRHSVISEITARRRNHTMRIARKIHILEKYKNTKIQGYEYAKDTKDKKAAAIALVPFLSPSPVSDNGARESFSPLPRLPAAIASFVDIVCIGQFIRLH